MYCGQYSLAELYDVLSLLHADTDVLSLCTVDKFHTHALAVYVQFSLECVA